MCCGRFAFSQIETKRGALTLLSCALFVRPASSPMRNATVLVALWRMPGSQFGLRIAVAGEASICPLPMQRVLMYDRVPGPCPRMRPTRRPGPPRPVSGDFEPYPGKMNRIQMVQTRSYRQTRYSALVALALALMTFIAIPATAHAAGEGTDRIHVQPGQSAVHNPSGGVQQGGLIDTITGKRSTPSAAATVTLSATPTATPEEIEVVIVTPTPAASPTTTSPAPTQSGVSSTDTSVITNPQGVIEGTVIANRTDSTVQFFVEGKTWQLDPLRSAGVELARATAVLNLLNCDATSSDQSACFWDPYLLQRDGFYEVVTGAEEGAQVNLVLRAAGAPPTDQIWIQNRLESAEQLYFGAEMRELAPASISEFTINPATPSVFYLRTCIVEADASTCEWRAIEAQPGTYYALTDESWQSGVPGATVVETQLSPILGTGASVTPQLETALASDTAATETSAAESTTVDATTATTPGSAQGTIVCTLAVPTLNVRSGPGLAFDVISKIMTTGDTPATVSVVGRTESNEWLQVDERQANGGWVINGQAYLVCPTDTSTLAVRTDAELPATPTPSPVAETSAGEVVAVDETSADEQAAVEASTELTATTETAAATAPAGLALLVVQNSFEQPVRFTLDQRYRVAEGPSEVDLAPGQSTSYVVYPGIVAFSASSAWRSLSGNAEILLEADETRTLYLIFVPDPGEEGKWIFQY